MKLATSVRIILFGALAGSAPAVMADSAGNDSTGLGEVVVTATKEVQDLQKTAAAITAVDADLIVSLGVVDIRAAQNLVPSVRFQPQNAATEIYIRGVGSTLDLPNIESPTALNFNGIYVPREVSAIPFFDMASIEVLPGPQGTLYGRGSLGGVVNANFARPQFENEGLVAVEMGNFSLAHVTAVGNFAASERFAVRLGVDYASSDGYMASGANSQDNLTARASLLWKASDAVDLYAWALHSRRTGESNNVVTIGVDPITGAYAPGRFLRSDPWDDTRTPAMLGLPSNPGLPPPQNPRALPTDGRSFIAGAELSVKLGAATLTYIPSYMDADVDVQYFFGAYPTAKYDEAKQWTQELRLDGSAGAISYLAGVYAYNLRTRGSFLLTGFPIAVVDENELKGYAAFGRVTWSVAEDVRLVLGGRFSHDDRHGEGPYTGFLGNSFVFGVPYTFDKTYSHADYKVGIEYDTGPSTMLYAMVQSGYQPGTFNTYPSTPSASNEVRDASLQAITAGFKARFLDDRLQVNDEVYFYDYKDLFASAYNSLLNVTQTFNAQKVRIYGNQLDVLYRPTEMNQLSFSLGYLHARNERFVLPDGSANYDGLQLQYAPDWTVNLGYFHDFPIGAGFLRAQVQSRFESSFYSDFSHVPGGRQDSYTKTDATLTYYGQDERWSFGVWIKNIENEAVLAATAVGSSSPLQPLGATTNLEPPRTYGVRANFKF